MEKQQQPEWVDVALTGQTKVEVSCSYKNNALLEVAENDGYVNLQMQDFEKGVDLEPAKSYKFRVAAVNSLGVGPWSEVTAYRTLTPGLPQAPNTVKVHKSDGGALVSWVAPSNSYGNVLEFAVFLAINVNNGTNKTPSFQRVYVGTDSSCLVSRAQLQNAMIDSTGGKPAIIFRIAAKNHSGYGPATQVRWLQ